jgi:ribose transport system permease protein
LRKAIVELPVLPVVLLVGVALAVTVDGFFSVASAQNVMRQLAVVLIAACGETLVLLIAGIDLSIGATIGLASVVGALAMRATGSVEVGLLACVGVGLVIGAFNGLAIARFGLPAFILTLSVLLTVRAIAFLITGGRSVGALPPDLLNLGRATVVGIPTVFVAATIVVVVVGFILNRTGFGQSIYLVGANERAALFSGINVVRTKFLVYLMSGILGGLAAFVFMLRLGSATPTAGDPLLLQIIGATVIGGTSLTGGEGSLPRTVVGALLVAMLVNGLDLMGANFYDQTIVIGILIALGSALGGWLSRQRTSESRRRAAPAASASTGSGQSTASSGG